MTNRLIPFQLHNDEGTLTVGEQISIDATGFDGNLDSNVDDVQALAQAVDDLAVGGTPGDVEASSVTVSNTNLTGLIANAGNAQVAFDRIDSTGLGAQPRTFTGTFFAASYGQNGNQDTWYGGRQTVILETERSQGNGRYTFQIPDATELGQMFDDLASRGLGEIYTIRLTHRAGSSTFINRNSLTVTAPSVSIGGFVSTTIAQGQSVTYRIERINSVIQAWERVGVQQAQDPVATFGEVVLQNTGWNNSDNSFLPPSDIVQKGYAFPVVGSNPNDGTLRQGLLDSGVSDRVIFDGDYVVWSADAFTGWSSGDDWFVLSRNDLQRMSRDQSNFLAQTTEIDSRVDVAPVQMLANDALVWLSENPLAAAPFLEPSTDTSNPRSGDNYAYIGGRENRNAQQQFQFSQNRFNSYITVGITPNFITAHPESDIQVRLYDSDRNIIENWNLATDFTFRNDGDFTNSTVRHYTRSTSVNYPFLATIEIWLTRADTHFRINPETVDVTQNVENLPETSLSADVQGKLNRALPPAGVSYDSIADRLSPYQNITLTDAAGDALFYSAAASDAYPSDLSSFTAVSESNPRFQATDVVMFVAVPEPGDFVLLNTTTDTPVALDNASPDIEVVESLSVSGTTYFIYRVTSVTSGNRFEVQRTTLEQVVAWPNSINNLQADVERIDAELTHAALNLPDALVNVLDNEVTVTEESSPTEVSTAYNNGLGNTNAQTVFRESSPNTPSGGSLNSNAFSLNTGDRARRKLLYIPAGYQYGNSDVLFGFDGVSTTTTLMNYSNGVFNARVRVPAIPASTTTSTVYPAPASRVSGAGIWQNIPTLTFVNGVPVPEADELFFTRNVPSTSTTITIQYRGHANGNVFGTSSTTLAGVGGPTDVSTTVTLNDGSETANVEILYRAAQRDIRVSVTERVNAGLPTINDVEVILSYDETRTVPATNAANRDVPLENLNTEQGQVFGFKPSSTGTLIIVGSLREVDTNRPYTDLFGATEAGHLSVAADTATFLDYEDFEPIASTVVGLENHASLPGFGLFSTEYTRETVVDWGTTFRPVGLNIGNLPTTSTGLTSGDVWNDNGTLTIVP